MKFVKIPTCKNILCGVLLFFITFNVIVLFSNAYGDLIILSNSSEVQNLNQTAKSAPLSENIIETKKINETSEKYIPSIKHINDTDTVIEVFPMTFEESLTKDDSNSSESNVLSLELNNTLQVVNNTESLQSPPPRISYIENEGVQIKSLNSVPKAGVINTSDEEEDDESSRNTSDEEEDDESSRNTSDEEEDDESSRNTNESITRELFYKKSNLISHNKLIGNKTIGNSIDNENDKLISQFSELNSSVMPNLKMQAGDHNLKTKDKKPIANAGLDQVITSDQNIVLDASASFDAEGKISSYLWKQTENSEGKSNTSNSMIYSFPIPEGLEQNTLEFKLIVTDEEGQIDTDTVNFLISDENDEENEN